jgi:integrase
MAGRQPHVGPGEQAGGSRASGARGPGEDRGGGERHDRPALLETLLDHKAASPFDGDDDLVFPTSKGRHDNPSNVRVRVLRPAIARANAQLALEKRPLIPAGLTPHSLRHTYCSLLIAQGEELSTVAAQMRHADLSTTLRV